MAPLQNSSSEPEFYAWTAAGQAACPNLLQLVEQKKNRGASPMECKPLSLKIVDCYSKTIEAMPKSPCADVHKEYQTCLETADEDYKHTACYNIRENLFRCVAQNIGPFDE
mmetsp:Transcript_1269/g.2791  ORF Transcript_1269/g.2791 Transcript_1269/m.2791 type:complete len:111 (-) Transcript_1269:143-475(-)|eukprot:CAMPEP_0172439108 /NCGR_PEP_ID=MMETSP1065-20121228/195_1 /TAXON_ID=265537 /ORGANISM="Amphiprora paludosa, Strain CCMP125" /LENGTH=110 /DNA_ID=CAMNT_0013187741 /DNA_START=65 /DNA_END=397 /DNA_ORIENTATION=-